MSNIGSLRNNIVPNAENSGRKLYVPLLGGEKPSLRLSNVSLLLKVADRCTIIGKLVATNYQLLHISETPMPGSLFVYGNYIVSVNTSIYFQIYFLFNHQLFIRYH